MARTLSSEHKADWTKHVNRIAHAYNRTRSEATGYAPFFLLFGRLARLPIDVVFGVKTEGGTVSMYKLRSFWEKEVHIVTQRMADSLVYEVMPEDGKGRKRVLHRNHLFQCDFLPIEGPQLLKQKRLLSRKKKNHRLNQKD